MVASRGRLNLSDIGINLDCNLAEWRLGSAIDLAFSSLQPMPAQEHSGPTPAFERTLLALAGEIGAVLSDQYLSRFENNQAALLGRLIPVMRTLVQASSEAGVTLEPAAQDNLSKIFDRWPTEKYYPQFLDRNSKPFEQLPRNMTIDIFEREVGGKVYVFQRCNGLYVGDRLTDNAMTPDDYRFHDVFHYAYVAVLGWSPVTRALLRLKRKSEPAVDEAEDGARAILIEEGVVSWIFGRATSLALFEGISPGELSFDILKQVRQFISGYESASLPLWLWEEAILQGFAAFRFIQRRRRGRVHIDMIGRQFKFEDLPYDA